MSNCDTVKLIHYSYLEGILKYLKTVYNKKKIKLGRKIDKY